MSTARPPAPAERATGSEPELPGSLKDRRRLAAGASFCFDCHRGLDCFTRCCSDVNIVLTPADVLSLSRKTGLTTGDFLDRHTLSPITKELHLPVVMLRMGEAPEKRCPFLGEGGCSVYDARPWACRMYPVGMALPPARAGAPPKPAWFLFEDDFCHGRGEAKSFTVESWRRSQGVDQRDDLEQGFQDLVGHPWFIGGRQLDPRRIEMFFMAAYDLDTFREFVFGTTFVKRFDLDGDEVEALRTDDRALLLFGFRWLRFALFGEPTLRRRDAAVAAGVAP